MADAVLEAAEPPLHRTLVVAEQAANSIGAAAALVHAAAERVGGAGLPGGTGPSTWPPSTAAPAAVAGPPAGGAGLAPGGAGVWLL
eukprot:8134798-Alexandrium_andersonii.AAC.1